MTAFPFLAQRLFNTPLAIRAEKAEIIMAALAERLGITRIVGANGRVLAFDDDGGGDIVVIGGPGDEGEAGYDVIEGVAVVEVSGTLIQKCASLRPYSGMTGYNAIRQNMATALADAGVAAIVLNVDSPGGEVSGLFDLCDAIYGARGNKPIWAVVDECACSGAYALASCADRVLLPRTGQMGSIGVIAMLVDFSRALERDGITVNILQYGKRKADGNALIPLAPEARAHFQKDIDAIGELFVDMVARNRRLSARAVRGQEAMVYQGADAVAQGLADAVMAPDQAFRALLGSLQR